MNNTSITLLTLSLLTTPAFAESQTETPAEPQAVAPVEAVEQQKSRLYVGLDVFNGETSAEIKASVSGFTSISNKKDFDLDGFRLKLGAELENNWRFQGYFKSEDADKFTENKIYGLGLDLIKSFHVSDKFSPFILAGIGYDWTKLEDEPNVVLIEDELSAVNLKLGLGAAYKITNSIEVLGGFDWQYRTWQDIELIGAYNSVTFEQKDTSKTLYLGLNVFF